MVQICPCSWKDEVDGLAVTVCFDQLDDMWILKPLDVFDVRPLKESQGLWCIDPFSRKLAARCDPLH
jgi:hypothetical protein